MKLTRTRGAIAAIMVLSGAALAASAPTGSEFGKREYEARCADCHGTTGRGDGVNKPWVEMSPADLTVLSRRNGGEFPYLHFYAVVEGRYERGRTMPCFVDVYTQEAAGDYMEVPYEADRYVDTRLVALAEHVKSLQVK